MNPLFLVDPKLIKSIDDFINLNNHFGICHAGRLLGLNPSDYVDMIYKTLTIEGHSERKLALLLEARSQLQQFSAKGIFSGDSTEEWKSASANFLHKGFVDQVVHHEEYPNIGDLYLDLCKRHDRGVLIKPTIDNFVSELKNIFKLSRRIIIIDPFYTDTNKRFDILLKLIEKGNESKICESIDIIVSYNKYYKEYRDNDGSSARMFRSKFNFKHSYTKVTYIIVNDQGNQNLLHARYLLCNLGGLVFDRGIGVTTALKEKISCLELNVYEEELNKYNTIVEMTPGSIVIPLNY